MSACLFANLSFFICFDILRVSETAVSDSDFLSSFKVLRKINSFDLFFPHFLFILLFPFLFRSFAVLLYRNRKER